MVAMVNQELVYLCQGYCWRFRGGYAVTRIKGRTVFMHNIVYLALWGFTASDGEEIDHIDRNRLNNLDSNLRRVSYSFNRANVGVRKNNTSGFKGVHSVLHHNRLSWEAQVMKDGRRIRKRFEFSEQGKIAAARFVNESYAANFPGVKIPNPEVV